MPLESSIVRSIRSALVKEAERRGAWIKIEKRHGSEYSRVGEPDLFGSLGGRHFEIEVKQPGKEPEPIQYTRLAEWARTGAITGWATCKDEALAVLWPDLKRKHETATPCTTARPSKKSETENKKPRPRKPRGE